MNQLSLTDKQIAEWLTRRDPWAVLRSDGKSFVFIRCPSELANCAECRSLHAPVNLSGGITP